MTNNQKQRAQNKEEIWPIYLQYENEMASSKSFKYTCIMQIIEKQTNRLHQYYNLQYNPSAPIVRSGFLVSYRIRSAMKTTAPRTAPHLKYIQGTDIPNKASFEILAMNTGLN